MYKINTYLATIARIDLERHVYISLYVNTDKVNIKQQNNICLRKTPVVTKDNLLQNFPKKKNNILNCLYIVALKMSLYFKKYRF